MEKKNEEAKGFAYFAIFIAVLGFVACMVCGCKQTEYVEVPVEVIKEHNVYVDRWNTDTLRDSVFNQIVVKEYLKGDTVYRDSIDIRYAWKVKVNTVYRDSINVKVDTISVAVPVEVEKKLTKWEKVSIKWFGSLLKLTTIMAALIILFVVYKVRKIIKS